MGAGDFLRSIFGWQGTTPPKGRKPGSNEVVTANNPYEAYSTYMKTPFERRRKYDIYDEMDEMDIISSVLDAYAEDSTQVDREKKKAVWVTAKDKKVKELLENMLQRIKCEEVVESIARDTGKQGDDFGQLYMKEGEGILGIDWRDPRDIERVENNLGILVGFEETNKLKGLTRSLSKKEDSEVNLTYKPWDIIHFRLYRRKRLRKQKHRNLYGTSLLAGSERIAKQVKILDDMLMVYRLTKSLDRNKYNVDVANSSVEEEIQILKRWKNALKRKAYIDPANQRYDSRFDPFSFNEDIFWPVREGSESSVDVISGQGDVSDIVDVELFIDRLFGSLRAPKGYFGFEGDIDAKASLSTQDIKWGRTTNSLQKAVRNGLTRLCQIELSLHDIDPMTADFNVEMVVASSLEELSRLESMQTMIDMAERLANLGEMLNFEESQWKYHIMKSTLGMTDHEINKYGGTDPNIDGEDPKGSDSEPSDPTKLDEVIGSLIKARMGAPSSSIYATESARQEELPYDKGINDTRYECEIHPIELPTESEDTDEEELDSEA